MPLDIMQALMDGWRRTFNRNGIMFVVLFAILGAINTYAVGSLTDRLIGGLIPQNGFGPVMGPTVGDIGAIGGSLALVSLLGFVTYLISIALYITATRVFYTDERERIPESAYTRNMGGALLNMVVGSIIFSILVSIGFVLFIIPGLFLIVSLLFFGVYIAVEDENFFEAMGSSWDLTGGHRVNIFIMLVGLFIVLLAFGIVGGIVFAAVNPLSTALGIVVQQLISSIGTVYVIASIVQAYRQLM